MARTDHLLRGLDPADCDDLGRHGHVEVSESARERLGGLIYGMAESTMHSRSG
ncbi:hypothetical protein ABZ567_20735 [Streptomyces sp. NPDC016459]|uniref:hypothetical protein n=1 Tax=Streptomyces sp. NPDC016459 TaxID=3157190 RepID=UPI0033C7457A